MASLDKITSLSQRIQAFRDAYQTASQNYIELKSSARRDRKAIALQVQAERRNAEDGLALQLELLGSLNNQ